jgi:predicted nucleotide-binding protein
LGVYGRSIITFALEIFMASNTEQKNKLLDLMKKPMLKLRSEVEPPPMDKTQVACSKDEIFIVHGRNNAVKHEVARFITVLGLKHIILHEQASEGKTIIEKFESHADVGFAIILLTADDVGKIKNARKNSPRARQNVIFEWGFFIGKLGRNRVCALHEKDVEPPSDLHGVVYLPLDDHQGWQMKLAKELKAAGYKIDSSKLL